ncbi:MAG: GH39 family glycosyl hydrolase [Bacteroidales bacterium]
MKHRKILILITLLIAVGLVSAKQKSKKEMPVRAITVDLAAVKGETKTVWRKCIGAGRANEGLRADWQEQLRLTKKECGFEYIRMHGLLHDDMGVYFEDKAGNPIYNWQYIDQLYDFLLSIDVKPFVELSFMPKALASGDKTCFWWNGNVTPPKSYEKWSNLIKALTQHFTDRYGKEEVKTWYFEVWNEPNLEYFYSSTQEEYFKLYDFSAKAVKSVCPDYRVGGPATAANAWIPEMIEYCRKNNSPIDFCSTHRYSITNGSVDDNGFMFRFMIQNKKTIIRDVISSDNTIKKSFKPNLELHFTEWSASPSSDDNVHDAYHSAAFILNKLKGTENYANSMSYWVFSDIFEEMGPRDTPFHGGFGLLNYQSIKKPAYYSYKFMNELGKTELQNADSSSWVCKNDNGDIQALIFDYSLTSQGDSIPNQKYYIRNLPAKDKGLVKYQLTNIPKGKYRMKITKVGYKSNDAYTTYLEMGRPHELTKKEVQTIKNINSGEPYITEVVEVESDNKFVYQFPIRENDVIFLNLVKL